MSELKLSSDNELRVFLSFHLVGEGKTYSTDKINLEKLLEAKFPGGVILDHEDLEGPQDREIVYRVSRTGRNRLEEKRAFFTDLQAIFSSTSSYFPSFTQGSESLA